GQSIYALFEAQANRTPDAPALALEREEISYAELNQQATLLAKHLKDGGVGPQTRVPLWLERSPELAVGILAILKAGGACVPLAPADPAEQVSLLVQDSQARGLFTRES